MNPRKILPLETLQILDILEREGTFSLAAAHLNKSVSTISYRVQKLEDDLGILILDRSGHRAVFTRIGQVLVDQGRQILTGSDNLIHRIHQLSSGWESELTLSYDGIIGQDIALTLIEKISAKCSTQLYIQEDILSGGWEALISGKADILISSILNMKLPNTINIKTIGTIDMVWVAAKGATILNVPDPLNESTRQNYPIVAVADTARAGPKTSRNILLNQKIITVSSMLDKISAIIRNIGFGTVPKHLIKEELSKGTLVEIGHARTVDVVVGWSIGDMGHAKTLAIKEIEQQFELRCKV
ncbi:LysR family transcriptional regulator [Vibrio mediterranei]|uniref:LysR family transcriptional regulator n=1 Tax=Vibrio mediterranei TaxID=689 RepID=UPI0022845E4D|nr:LysR family transcriptional regulator [Vibrio mediterranei]MCY9855449.1 LysR family transcriptional regulator [Vibrio mediterranei]